MIVEHVKTDTPKTEPHIHIVLTYPFLTVQSSLI